jgi:hypothetical protein
MVKWTRQREKSASLDQVLPLCLRAYGFYARSLAICLTLSSLPETPEFALAPDLCWY